MAIEPAAAQYAAARRTPPQLHALTRADARFQAGDHRHRRGRCRRGGILHRRGRRQRQSGVGALPGAAQSTAGPHTDPYDRSGAASPRRAYSKHKPRSSRQSSTEEAIKRGSGWKSTSKISNVAANSNGPPANRGRCRPSRPGVLQRAAPDWRARQALRPPWRSPRGSTTRLACGRNSIFGPQCGCARSLSLMRRKPPSLNTSAAVTSVNAITSGAAAPHLEMILAIKIPIGEPMNLSAPKGKGDQRAQRGDGNQTGGAGFCQRRPSIAAGPATNASNAAALSQMPRLKSEVFLNEITCIAPRIEL